MNFRNCFRVFPVVCLFVPICSVASTGPDDRAITDPKSVNSEANANARPAPIGDLYYTTALTVPPGPQTANR